jgi:hypothetical protein
LPELHAVAVRLRDGGVDDHVIALALGIDAAAVGPLLHIADSKLANLIAHTPGSLANGTPAG